jgi:hypothetical protein
MTSVSKIKSTGEQSPQEPTDEEIKKAALEMAAFIYDRYKELRRDKHGKT